MQARDAVLVGLLLFFSQFVYSGIDKVRFFPKKVKTLRAKTGLGAALARAGIAGAVVLEILGSLLVLACFAQKARGGCALPGALELLGRAALGGFLVFVVAATAIYHPPGRKMIPFMSNVSVLGAFVVLLAIL